MPWLPAHRTGHQQFHQGVDKTLSVMTRPARVSCASLHPACGSTRRGNLYWSSGAPGGSPACRPQDSGDPGADRLGDRNRVLSHRFRQVSPGPSMSLKPISLISPFPGSDRPSMRSQRPRGTRLTRWVIGMSSAPMRVARAFRRARTFPGVKRPAIHAAHSDVWTAGARKAVSTPSSPRRQSACVICHSCGIVYSVPSSGCAASSG